MPERVDAYGNYYEEIDGTDLEELDPEDIDKEAKETWKNLREVEKEADNSALAAAALAAAALAFLLPAAPTYASKESAVRAALNKANKKIQKEMQRLGVTSRPKTYEELLAKYANQATGSIAEALRLGDEAAMQKAIDAAIKTYESNVARMLATEIWRQANKDRAAMIKKKGFKYKTTKHIFDKRTGNDSRYFASMQQIKKLDEPFSYSWRGRRRTFMYPPDRPRDRAIVIPYLPL